MHLEKTQYAKASEYVGDKFINVILSTIDENHDAKTTFNKEFDMKVVCLLIPKYNKGDEFGKQENAIYLPYSEYVRSITLQDGLDSIGMKGEVEVLNQGKILEGIFDRFNNYYFVINFTQYVNGGKSIKYEPYIFDISNVETITKGYKKEQIVKISLTDIITSILQSHSIANFIKHEGAEITKAKNYKYVFKRIIDYVKRYIKINSDNYFEFKKDVIYDENTLFDGGVMLNGYDSDIDLSALVENSFNKVNKNASIWDALKVMLKDCVTSIKLDQEQQDRFETIGDVLIPFFFKEEYSDINGIYYNLWNSGNEENNGALYDVIMKDYGGKSLSLVLRNISLRDFFMPFYLCFSYDQKGAPFIFEDINDSDVAISTLNGKINDTLQSLTFSSLNKGAIDKRWKNVIFLQSNGSGTNSTLIFFDWFYKYFLKVFLNSSQLGGTNNYVSNVIPDYYLFSLKYGIGHSPNGNDETFDNLFDSYNSYTVSLNTNDTVNEALREMGKNLTSLVLLNDTYNFSLNGNLLRRPNEIMRLNVTSNDYQAESQLPIHTGLKNDSSLLVYIRQVTHVFKGDSYINNIIASKICERV